jgi:hypothetical protein
LIFIYVINQVIITHSAHLTNWAACPDTVVWPTLFRRPKEGTKTLGALFGTQQLAPTASVGYNFIVSNIVLH